VVWGIVQIIHGQWADGLWIAFIGWFLNSAAAGSYQRLAWQQAFAGHTAREVMMTDCPTIPRRLTLDALVDHVVLPSGRRCFPVVADNQLEGLLTLHGIKAIPRSRWPATRVEDVMIPIRNLKTVKADDELQTVFDRMVDENINQFPVVEDGQLLGIVARDNLMRYLSTRREIGMT
jgi:CBS domain-containing protein